MDVSRIHMLILRAIATGLDGAAIYALSIVLITWTQNLLMFLVPMVLYFPLCEWLLRGFTPGKWICRIRVIAPNGEPPSLNQVLIRSVFRLVEVNPFVIGAIPAAIAVLCSSHAQRLGDMWAFTFVVPVSDIPAVRKRIAEMEEAPSPQPES
ncbi:RDD family protein [Metapseudomonas otitidis]|uniref:RDD family protein n=1 Tax=Metapseudomonas otitidis TaxID=319939 RepID=UPI003CF97F40